MDCVVPGEELKAAFADTRVLLEGDSNTMTNGILYITNFQFIFAKTSENGEVSCYK